MKGILQEAKEVPSKNPKYPDPCGSIKLSTQSDGVWVQGKEWKQCRVIAVGTEVEYELSDRETSKGGPILASIHAIGGSAAKSGGDNREATMYVSYAKDLICAGKAASAKEAMEIVSELRDDAMRMLTPDLDWE